MTMDVAGEVQKTAFLQALEFYNNTTSTSRLYQFATTPQFSPHLPPKSTYNPGEPKKSGDIIHARNVVNLTDDMFYYVFNLDLGVLDSDRRRNCQAFESLQKSSADLLQNCQRSARAVVALEVIKHWLNKE